MRIDLRMEISATVEFAENTKMIVIFMFLKSFGLSGRRLNNGVGRRNLVWRYRENKEERSNIESFAKEHQIF